MHRQIATLVLGLWGWSATAVTYHDDIRPIVETKCMICHSEAGVSFSFEDPEFAISFGPAMVSAVSEKRMPPWLAEDGHREYVDDYSLSADQIKLFQAWAASGFAEGSPHKTSPSTETSLSNSYQPDLSILVNDGAPYLPRQDRKDDYRCFLMPWPQKERSYITGFQARPGNLRVAHHLVLFAAPPELADTLRALDDQEKGLGYQCFGGGIPDRIGDPQVAKQLESQQPGMVQKLNDGVHWVAHWAPGMDGYDFPEGTGIPIEPGSLLIVQMHYFSAFAPGESDQGSKMGFKLAKDVKKPGFYIPLTNQDWLQGKQKKSMVIPAKSEATYRVGLDFEKFTQIAARHLKTDPKHIASLELHSANIHMHAIGKSSRVYIEDKWGGVDTLLNIPKWDLSWQRDFTFKKHMTFHSGNARENKLVIECTFLNPKEQDAYGGFGSDDEMCFNFSYFALNLKDKFAH